MSKITQGKDRVDDASSTTTTTDATGGGSAILERLKADWNQVVSNRGRKESFTGGLGDARRGGKDGQGGVPSTPDSKRKDSSNSAANTPDVKRKGSAVPSSATMKRKVLAGDAYRKGCDLIRTGDAKAFRDWLTAQCKEDVTLLEQVDDHGWTLFHVACNGGKVEQAYTLLEAGADLEALTGDGSTALHFLGKLQENERQPASMYEQMLHVIGNKGAKVLHPKHSGDTPLHIAALRGNSVALGLFIEWGCPLNAQTVDAKFTALHYAVMGNRLQIVKDLVKAGIDINVASTRGTAVQLAEQLQLADITEFFKSLATERGPQDEAGEGAVVQCTVGNHTPQHISGCWDEYRDNIFPKTHFIFYLDVVGFICIVPNRPNDLTGDYEGLLLKNTGFQPLVIQAASLELYRTQNLTLPEQLRRYLDSRGLLHTTGRQLAQLNASMTAQGQDTLRWVQMLKPEIPMRLLEMETRLTPRKRISVGVIMGKAEQSTEEEMFANQSCKSFEKFLGILGEKIQIGKWPGWTGTLRGGDDNGIICYYTCWMGFEFIFHIAPFLDPQKQRQHIGNDMCLIYWKDGPLPKFEFRGQVNSVAIVVTPSKKPVGGGGGSATALAEEADANHLKLPASKSSPRSASPRRSGTSKRTRKVVTLSCFHRKSLTGFVPNLPEKELEIAAYRHTLRSYILSTLVNGSMATLKSGPFSANTTKLFTAAIAKIIEEEKAFQEDKAAASSGGK